VRIAARIVVLSPGTSTRATPETLQLYRALEHPDPLLLLDVDLIARRDSYRARGYVREANPFHFGSLRTLKL
jgi:hypothetical protein